MNPLRHPTRFYEMVSLMPHQGHSLAAESDAQSTALAPLDKRLVQAIWNQQLLKNDVLITPDGKPVKVFDPGQWNGEAGPDFRNADVSIGGLRFRGDVEIHVHATDWERHGHQADFEYNNVVLHAVLFRDDDRVADDLQNGHIVSRLTMEDFLEPDLETIRQTLAGEDYFRTHSETDPIPECRHLVARLDNGYLNDFLNEAARERMETRVERYANQSGSSSLDQALYQALMTSLGHKGGKTLFFLLARRVTLNDLRLMLRNVPPTELPLAIESVLLNVASLTAPWAEALRPDDTDALDYLTAVTHHWKQFEIYFADRIIPPTKRWMSGMRPANFPMRRIAGISRWLAQAAFGPGLTRWFADQLYASMGRVPKSSRDFKREITHLVSLFTSDEPCYWSTHFTFGGKQQARPTVLLGDDKAASMLFNAVLPVMLLYARHMGDDLLEKYVWRLHAHFPALQQNTITRFMRHRLFGSNTPMPAGLTFRLEFQNQAMIQIFNQCCSNSDLTCAQCLFRVLHAKA